VLFFWVAMVCVLAYAVAFVLTEWVGLYDAPRPAASPAAPAAVPASAPATAPPAAPSAPSAEPSPASPSAPGPAASSAADTRDLRVAARMARPARPAVGICDEVATAGKPAVAHPAMRLLFFERAAGAAEPSAPAPGGTPKFFGVPAVPAGQAPPKEAPKDASAPTPAAPKDAETKGEAVARPETPLPEQQPLTAEERRARAEYCYDVTLNTLRPLRVVGVIASFLLGVTLFLYLQIALLGRLSGIRQLTSALFFMILFFATALPWESIFEGFRANVFYDFPRLVAAHGERLAGGGGDFWEQAKYFARFFGLPLVSLGLLVWSGLQFAAGYGESVVANE